MSLIKSTPKKKSIAAAVIGGTSLSAGGIGTVAGTIVGALIIGVLNKFST